MTIVPLAAASALKMGRMRLKPAGLAALGLGVRAPVAQPSRRLISMDALMAHLPKRHKGPPRADVFAPAKPMPGVVPKGTMTIAQDSAEALALASGWAAGAGWNDYGMAYGDNVNWLGYPFLAELTQRPEYRRPAEIIAKEMTRKWIRLKAIGEDDKAKKIKVLEEAFRRLRVRDAYRNAIQLDGFFGRAHIYYDVGATDPAEKALPLIRDPKKVKKGSLRRLQVIEPMWTFADDYNSIDPTAADYYRPNRWFVQSALIHASRMVTLVAREMPDLLKPAYSFGGLSLSQMGMPYVNNWLRARQSVSDLMASFSYTGIKTDMSSALQGDGIGVASLANRVAMFTALRDNRGTMVLNKDTEDFFNMATPLGTLDALQAQAQEHLASVWGIPLVVLLGITPSGLNASSDGEIRSFYAWVHAQQEDLLRDPLTDTLNLIQLSEFGEIDHEISFDFVPLWQQTDKEAADTRKVDADTYGVYVNMGVIEPADVRKSLAGRDDPMFAGVDLTGPPPEPPEPMGMPGMEGEPGAEGQGQQDDGEGEEDGKVLPFRRGAADLALDAWAALDAYVEADHPRDADGKFTTVAGGESLHQGIADYLKAAKESGKAPTSTALIKHLVQKGGIPTGEIAGAASTLFQNTAHGGHVSLAHKGLTEAGKNPPPLISSKGAKGLNAPAPAPKPPPPPPAPPAPPAPPPIAPEAGGLPKPGEFTSPDYQKIANNAYAYATNPGMSDALKVANLQAIKNAAPSFAFSLHAYIDKLAAAVQAEGGAPAKAPVTLTDLPKVDSDMLSTSKVKAESALAYINTSNDPIDVKIKNLEFLNTNTKGALKDYLDKLTGAVKEQAGIAPPAPAAAPPPPPPAKPLSPATQQEFTKLKEAWANVLPENKPIVDSKAADIQAALDKPTEAEQKAALAALKPISDPQGMGQKSVNDFLAKVQAEYGALPAPPPPKPATPPSTAKLPPGKPSAAVFHAAKVAPHKTTITESEYEDASGGTVTARLEARTKNIPGDHYAKVTAAYGNSTDAMTQAVDKAMQAYANDTHASHTAEQLEAIAAYRDGEYGSINQALSGLSKPSAATQKHIDQIHGAMKNSFVPADTPVFRGLSSPFASVTGFGDPQEAVGRAFVHKNFASVSRSESKAKDFGDQTVLSFTIPAGTPGVVMKGQASNENLVEREIMMDSNSMFRVEKVVQSVNKYGGTSHVVHCTYLGRKT
jgi:hypothetical protein